MDQTLALFFDTPRRSWRRAGGLRRPTRHLLFWCAVVLLSSALAPTSEAVQLEEASVSGGAATVLSNGTGTIRLEHPTVMFVAQDPSVVPEPGEFLALVAGLIGLALLHRLRTNGVRRVATGSTLRPGVVATLVLALFVVVPESARAGVPERATFSGRLTDDMGTPLVGPVDLELRIVGYGSTCCIDNHGSGGCDDNVCQNTVCYDNFEVTCCAIEWGPTCASVAANVCGNLCDPIDLYTETHLGVALASDGAFTVQIGTGSSQMPFFGAFDPSRLDMVAEASLEVRVGGQLLSPPVPLTSVPWALVAARANEVVRPSNFPRFEGCGDGTFADYQSGLQWEAKTGSLGSVIDCDAGTCTNPHDVNNRYTLTSATPPGGPAVSDFIARLNGEYDPNLASGCFADHCDWRLPKISELQTILVGPEAAPGQDTTCIFPPCIDIDAALWAGPVASAVYGAPRTQNGSGVAHAHFESGLVDTGTCDPCNLRAVRTGGCD